MLAGQLSPFRLAAQPAGLGSKDPTTLLAGLPVFQPGPPGVHSGGRRCFQHHPRQLATNASAATSPTGSANSQPSNPPAFTPTPGPRAPNRALEPARHRPAIANRRCSANIAPPNRPTTPKPAPDPARTPNSRQFAQPLALALGGWRELAEPQVRVSAKTGPGTKIAGFGNDFLRNGPFAALTWGYTWLRVERGGRQGRPAHGRGGHAPALPGEMSTPSA